MIGFRNTTERRRLRRLRPVLLSRSAGALLVAALVACAAERLSGPAPAAYALRALSNSSGSAIPVPAALAYGTGDTMRYLGGAFELHADGTWRERWERALVNGGAEWERRVFESNGRYRVVERRSGAWVLDLYPGQAVPAVVSPIAVLRGDTLSHSLFIYAR